ncbi:MULTISPECIES: response regulator [unclassified Rhizobium]|uniref:response regulator n=1 Tax=unclassified Rhizobium TaxID=2613769 RepID=UPI001AD9ABCE|nr:MULTISPECIES: response regulator [unclassified Rhizobium]MBO9100237.1 response regulator [Rhizobium sp. L58/93]MBO9135606.1 response regulator [Rhizobium sp. B209b/85]MBO9170203.1 response regulator [Rhizobium sp. L245/93]MBO9186130.1 response regulator [Rhizobium sp. E27B/91]QXZ83056.1 response regulator [Rhizobium sp. K1/93]
MDRKVLIVEDELLIALDLEDMVESNGLQVAAIANTMARALAAAPHADIALVDVNLSDGPTGPAIGRMLAEQFGIAVVFMTANPEVVSGGIQGTLGVLRKPVQPGMVAQALKYALGRLTGQLAAVPRDMEVFAA